MIRINLLGQARPKGPRRRRAVAVPLEATLQIVFLVAALVISFGVLFLHWHQMNEDVKKQQDKIAALKIQKAHLEQLKQQVEAFERQKAVLQQRINVIEELQRNRTGGQELLDTVATTVTRTDTLWLTSLTRKGSALVIEGQGASINAVANFITQLKRSGYFQKVEIKESKQDERNTAIQTFVFTLMAEFAPPTTQPPSAAPAPPVPRKG